MKTCANSFLPLRRLPVIGTAVLCGLLVSCDAASVPQVLKIFAQHGFEAAAEIGEVLPAGSAGAARLVVR